MTKQLGLVLGLTAAILLTAACSGRSTTPPVTTGSTPGGGGLSTVLFVGDSVAVGEAVPLTAAFAASNVHFRSIAAEGGGNVVGPFADHHWAELPGEITSAKASVVVYQITTYDWGSEQEQRQAYERLLRTVTDTGAKLAFVTMPPIRPDDFYRPHMAELDRTRGVAQAVTDESSGRASTLDADSVWGKTYQQDKDGKADRSSDGIHTCPQGAARFATWLLGALAKLFPGFTPADPGTWANTGWSADKHFTGC